MKLFDAHLHIIDSRFPLVANGGYLPDAFTCGDYLLRMKDYDLYGGANVSGSFLGFDQSYLLEAIKYLGPAFVGVVNLPATVSDQEILEFHSAGVRAVRFSLMQGGSENVALIESLARRVFEICNWHIGLYVDSSQLQALYGMVVRLPAICVDYLGVNKDGFSTLLNLVEKGAYVKASGFGRIEFDVINTMQQIYSINPAALMFATDLPSTHAPRAYNDNDFNLIVDSFSKREAENIFYNNAIAFYSVKGVM